MCDCYCLFIGFLHVACSLTSVANVFNFYVLGVRNVQKSSRGGGLIKHEGVKVVG